MIHVGFTGTQRGMAMPHMLSVRRVLAGLGRPLWAHHGDCIGADKDFHDLCRETCRGIVAGITGHPPDNPVKRAFCQFDVLLEPKPYLVRNHDIVDDTSIMIATPGEADEVVRSGTWATVRYARAQRRPLYLVLPSGEVRYEPGQLSFSS